MSNGNSMSATMSPFVSGTTSPLQGNSGNFPQGRGAPSNQSMPPHFAAALQAASSGQSSAALAYANAQLSHYAQQPGGSQQMPRSQGMPMPANGMFAAPQQQQGIFQSDADINQQLAYLFAQQQQQQQNGAPPQPHPYALAAALNDYYAQSVPNSAPSSPGAQYRRLHSMGSGYPSGTMTGHNTPGGNPRIAASSITGKRLNWAEMICQTIAESDHGRLVIQDLFDQMVSKFPEIREWAFTHDWDARVKNRIKSTLSIKGNLFIKVARPSSATGKGSWWTLSSEAQTAYNEGRLHTLNKSATHSRNSSQVRAPFESLSMSTATSRANSRAPSRRGSPISSRGPSSQHAQHANQHAPARSSQAYVNFSQNAPTQQSPQRSHPSNNSPSSGSGSGSTDSRRPSPSAGLPHSLGMSPINLNVGSQADPALPFGMPAFDHSGDMNGFEMSQRGPLGRGSSEGGDPFGPIPLSSSQHSMSFMPAASQGPMSMGDTPKSAGSSGPIYGSSGLTPASSISASNMGGPASMPFPPSPSKNDAFNNGFSSTGANYTSQPDAPIGLNPLSSDPTFGAFADLDLSGLDGLNNPFGTLAGGYTMLGENGSNSSAQPTAIPGRSNNGTGSGEGSGSNSKDNSGGRTTPSASSFNAAVWFSGPSPADSTGSQFFAYTPAMNAADAAVGGSADGMSSSFGTSIGGNGNSANGTSSALGSISGDGSRKRRDMLATSSSELALDAPPADSPVKTEVKEETER